MSRDEISARVIAVIAKTQHLDPASIQPESTFEGLGLDSLDGINIAFGLESEFDVNIPDDALPKLRSVADITDGIARLLEAKEASA